MSTYQFIALILVVVGPVLALSRSVGAPPSLALFGVGLASTQIPGLPQIEVDPQLVLNLFLPPLLYASTVRVSWHLLRFTLLPGVVLGVVIVLATAASVAVAARLLLPGLPWTGALLLGVVASVFDTRLFHEARGRPPVPRAIADTLKAREMVGRIVILATFTLLLETAGQGRISPMRLLEHYVLDIPAGILLGLAIGYGVTFLRQRIELAPIEIAFSIATPFAASLAATVLGVSGVSVITAAALVISTVRIDRRTGAPISSSEARINSVAFWEEISLVISSVLFLLAGRALPEALGGLGHWPAWQLGATTAAVLALVLIVQFGVSYVSAQAQPIRGVIAAYSGPGGIPRAAAAGVMAWASTRSVIGLVIALSIPASLPDGRAFPERDLILVIAALTILGSVLLQGLTLRAMVAGASLHAESELEQEKEEARQAMTTAAAAPGREHINGFDAARQALLRLRERNRIGDEILVSMLRETDLTSRAAEGNALPGAGPPNP